MRFFIKAAPPEVEFTSHIQFMKGDFWLKNQDLKPNFEAYAVFAGNTSETADSFRSVAFSAIQILSQNTTTVIRIGSLENTQCYRGRKPVNCIHLNQFLSSYATFLTSHMPEIPTCFQDNQLTILTNDVEPILSVLSAQLDGSYSLDICCYNDTFDFATICCATELSEVHSHVVCFEYGKCPDFLNIIVDNRKISCQRVFDSVQAACDAMGEVLEVFPQS